MNFSAPSANPERGMRRFDILVLNFERVHLFFENFHKLINFDAARDRVVVLDCSRDPHGQREVVENFARERGWRLGGPRITFETRPNWGIDQGARVDYLSALHGNASPAPFVWQFQEHYLDNTSDYSRYPANAGALAGTVKDDVIPDGLEIDLDRCERAFEDPEVSVVCANRTGVRVFLHPDGREWFISDGANLAFRTNTAISAFSLSQLDDYRLVFDGSYRWAGFFEFEFGRCLSRGSWFDLVHDRTWRNLEELRAAEQASGTHIASIVQSKFVSWIDRYERRIARVRGLKPAVRKALLATLFPALGAFQTRLVLPLRAKLMARSIDSPQWLREIW